MSAWLDRVRQALAPQYSVERELASGGMGIVYLGRDEMLQRRVAIKILRPELVTATTAERFLREARILARLSHPNIVPIHHAGDTDGILYYVMDLIEGTTLADRLDGGPLPPEVVHRLAADLLEALEATHGLGVIHRDIKPANIFLVAGRAVLVDFGIAHSVSETDTRLTVPGHQIGTLAYMAPEQIAGGSVTPQTDLYAVGLVLYEATTGRRWESLTTPAEADWRGVPPAMERALRGALALSSAERWDDAKSFRRALEGRRRPRVLAPLAAGLVVAIGVWAWRARSHGEPPLALAAVGTTLVAVGPFEARAVPAAGALADSLSNGLLARLSGHPDLTPVRGADQALHGQTPALWVRGTIEPRGDTFWLSTVLVGAAGASRLGYAGVLSPGGWQAVADSLVDRTEDGLWDGTLAKDPFLPSEALPLTPAGRVLWKSAERLYAQARWSEADAAYREAEAADATCLLCSVRIIDIDRWLSRPHEQARLDRLRSHRSVFPAHYKALLIATELSWPARGESLAVVAERFRGFYLGWYLLGDELFHRGPLFRRQRREAIAPLEKAVQLKPGFAPGWQHLAWALTDAGDSAGALAALGSLLATGEAAGGIDLAMRLLVQAGFGWRFGFYTQADSVVARALRDPAVSALPDFASAPRMMQTFEAPAGAVRMGKRFAAERSRSELRLSGMLAQLFGYTTLGRRDSAQALLGRIRDESSDQGLDLFLAEYAAALVLWEPSASGNDLAAARRGLERFVSRDAASAEARRRARWMLALLARREGREQEARARTLSLSAEPEAQDLVAVLKAEAEAWRKRYEQALDLTARLGHEESDLRREPFLRTVVRLDRARWFGAQGNYQAAQRELLWPEHQDVENFPAGPPQAAEVDWAFGTLARWERAKALDQAGNAVGGSELCTALAEVVRQWARGDPPARARADSAAKSRQLQCRLHP